MNDRLPSWLERALDIPRAEPGQGAALAFEYAWPWPGFVGWLLAACAILFVAYCYHREAPLASRRYRTGLACIRVAILAVVALMLSELSIAITRTGLPTVVLLVDDSRSMEEVDARLAPELREQAADLVSKAGLPNPTRLNLAKAILGAGDEKGLLNRVSREYDVRTYFVSDTSRAATRGVEQASKQIQEIEPSGASTRLGDGVRRILADLRGAPPAAIVLITDGVNTAGEPLAAAAEPARNAGVPIFSIGLGDPTTPKDLKIADVSVSEVVFAGDLVPFTVQLNARGMKGESAKLVLREKRSSAPLASATVEIESDGLKQAVIHFAPPEEGEFEFTIEVEAAPDETDATNNQMSRRVTVRNQLLRVLYIQSNPSFEFRYLKHLLERSTLGNDPSRKAFELKTVLQEADVEYVEQDTTALRIFPVDREELHAFDCLIFGDVNPGMLIQSNLEDIRDFVTERGGGLAIIAGPRYTPLAYESTPLEPLFPIYLEGASSPAAVESISEGFRVRPTSLGLSLPGMQLGTTEAATRSAWNDLPELYWLLEASRVKPAARILAEHPLRQGSDGKNLPVFVMQYVGSGEVLMHLTDETRLWRQQEEELFARYWVQTIRYLSRSRRAGGERGIVLSTDDREYRQGDAVRFTARFRAERDAPAENDGLEIVVEHDEGADQRLRLRRRGIERGIFEEEMNGLSPGKYHAWIESSAADTKSRAVDFVVLPPADELSRLDMDAEALSQAAEATGGRFYRFDKAQSLSKDLPRGKPAPMESLPPRSLWDRWPTLVLLLTLLLTEWLLRKRRGML